MTTEATEVRMEVSGIVELPVTDRVEAHRLVAEARAVAANLAEKGSLAVTVEGNDYARPVMRLSGSVPVALRVLEVTRFDGERLFPEGAATALAAVASPATRARAVAVNDHLIAAADNHPREVPPGSAQAEDDGRGRLQSYLRPSRWASRALATMEIRARGANRVSTAL
jgi:hypothetical protein